MLHDNDQQSETAAKQKVFQSLVKVWNLSTGTM